MQRYWKRRAHAHTFCSDLLPLPASNPRTPAIRPGSDLGRVPTTQSANSRGPAWSGQGRSTLGRVQNIAGVRGHSSHCSVRAAQGRQAKRGPA